MKTDPLSFSIVRKLRSYKGQNPTSAYVPLEPTVEVPLRKKGSVILPMATGLALLSLPIAGTVASGTYAAKIANKMQASVEMTLKTVTSAVKSLIK